MQSLVFLLSLRTTDYRDISLTAKAATCRQWRGRGWLQAGKFANRLQMVGIHPFVVTNLASSMFLLV